MVKKELAFGGFLIFLVLLLDACSPTICSTPYILSQGDCCLDKNQDSICDTQQDLPPAQQPALAQALTPHENTSDTSLQLPTTDAGVLLTVDPDNDPHKGSEDYHVVLIEFGDYTNANVRRFHNEVLPQLLEKYGDKITYVFRDFPEVNNNNALSAAEASECANEQGKFWQYHDSLLSTPGQLNPSTLHQFAADINLDVDAFASCFSSHRYREEVLHDRDQGITYAVSQMPTFFLNNKRISGFKTSATFDPLFQEALHDELQAERGKSTTASSSGLAYSILQGPAALDATAQQSFYSNSLELVDAVFSVSAQDKTEKDSPVSKDSASLILTYSPKKGGGISSEKEIYTLTLENLLTQGISHSFYGGVGIDVPVYGNSGVGTRYLPKTNAYLTLWGLATLKKNKEIVAEHALVHFVIVSGIRDKSNHVLDKEDPLDIQAYALITPWNNEPLPFTNGFLYLFWPNVNLRQM